MSTTYDKYTQKLDRLEKQLQLIDTKDNLTEADAEERMELCITIGEIRSYLQEYEN